MRITEQLTKTMNYEVCVVGGGIAGVCAAISAARNGAKTALIQDRPVLGGNASSEVRMWICGAPGHDNKEAGLVEELQLTNLFLNPGQNYHLWDQTLYTKIIEEPLIDLYLNTSVIYTKSENDSIQSIQAWQLTSQTWFHFNAKLFIDCSGDSILRYCGAEFSKGKEAKSEFNESLGQDKANSNTMGNSILLQCKEVDEHVPYQKPSWAYEFTDENFNGRVTKITKTNNFWWIEYGGLKDTLFDAEEIRMEVIKISLGVWSYMKNHPDGRCKNWDLSWVGALPGKRENIRYVGEHVLTQNDLEQNVHFKDRIGHGGWPMDDHPSDGFYNKVKPTVYHKTPSRYEIPFSSLYSVNIKNLLFAGRNISATHMALSSTRVMGTCGVMGQAVGTAAAICIKENILPAALAKMQIEKLQKILVDQDQLIPNYKKELSLLFHQAIINLPEDQMSILKNGMERDENNEINSIDIKKNQPVEITWSETQKVNKIRLVFDSNLKDRKHIPCTILKQPEIKFLYEHLPKQIIVKTLNSSNRWENHSEVNQNYKRLLEIPICKDTLGVQICITETWGNEVSKVFTIEPS
jgi:hypothetical protein